MLYDEFDSHKKFAGADVFKNKALEKTEVLKSLNPDFLMREYQKEAFGRFYFYMEEYQGKKTPVYLLFNMATGSGKTLIMAGNILYLYEQGYRDFIFFVNSTNIIDKTRDNFLNAISSKYLFNQKIIINDKQVLVKEVQNFEVRNKDDINIIFTTIHGLHSRLNNPSENKITYEDFEDKKIVLLSDEAHHINALTKSNLNKEEKEEKQSWEGTVQKIFNANKGNIMLEFTATIDLSDENVAKKYEDKIIYKYSLKEFRLDGFSKEVGVLEVELKPIDRALYAIIISQYRRKVAEKYKQRLKPVILFKSQKIDESKKFYDKFLNKIKNLKVEDLKKTEIAARNLVNIEGKETVLIRAFEYFKLNKISFDNLVKELKTDFSENRCIEINSKEESESKQILVNTLEDEINDIRAIFAVDKLNEGWDVLNLFDIVRVNEGRDARHNRPGPTTMREAQLIGRGARYWPFKLEEKDEKFKRKYDEPKNETENELKILEELYYHSRTNPRYIQELKVALKQTGILPDNTREIDVKVKESIKKERFWREGVVCLNEPIKNTRQNISSLKDLGVADKYEYNISSKVGSESILLNDKNVVIRETSSKTISFMDIGYFVVRKAINKLPFYYFDNLKKYLPNLESNKVFFESKKYLANIKIDIKGEPKDLYSIDSETRLNIALDILEKISKDIQNNTFEYQGAKEFSSRKIKEIVKDKKIKIENNDIGEQEYGRGMKETNNRELYLDLGQKSWYIYDENYGTSEEKYFVKFINDSMEKLESKYKEVYLLRNERLFKIFRFSDGSAMEPDFVLFLRKKGEKEYLTYQLFIEAKGDDRITNEDSKWKEVFLVEIEKGGKVELMNEDDKFKLVGMPLYNKNSDDKFIEKFNYYL